MRTTIDDAHSATAVALEEVTAQRDALVDALSSMVALVTKQGGYMSHEQQAAFRGARALLAELGR